MTAIFIIHMQVHLDKKLELYTQRKIIHINWKLLFLIQTATICHLQKNLFPTANFQSRKMEGFRRVGRYR